MFVCVCVCIKLLSLHLQVLLSRSATDLSLFVEEVEHTPQDGQQQNADNDDSNDDTIALWWRGSTRTITGSLTCKWTMNEMTA